MSIKNKNSKKLAVVTGASSGIGYELAKVFAKNGFDLIVAAEDPGIAEAAQAFMAEGVNVDYMQVDLTTFDGVERLYGKINSTMRPVEALALNAGVGVSGDFVRQTDLQAELDMIRLNVISPVHLAKRVAKDMVDIGHGRILITSSIAATAPAPYLAIYGATKAFLQSFAQAIRSELKGTGVTVTSLMPGPTDTHFFERAGMQDTKAGTDKKDDPEEVAVAGFEALMAGKDHVIAGAIKNKIQGVMGKILPEPVAAKMQSRETKPDSAPEP